MKNRWHFINKSVTGASHRRKNVPCQDYSLCVCGEDGQPPVIMAVSDGHGGSRYFRSAQGAVFACETAVEIAHSYADAVFRKGDANIVRQITETRLKLDIVKRWRELVVEHAARNPFSEGELQLLGMSALEYEGALDSEEIADCEKVFAAYGATLLVAVILDNALITVQIGDGDILLYYGRDGTTVLPVPKDDRLLGNETTSLCALKAPFYMRHNVAFAYEKTNMPDLLMCATDGYANSFASTEDYHRAAKDFYDIITAEGAEFVEKSLEGWLNETSGEGSGDDITLAVAWRV